MEDIHKTYRRPWISDLVSVQDFLENGYHALAPKFDIKEELNETLHERMTRLFADPEELDKLEKSCSPALLDCDGEEFIEFSRDFQPPEGNTLETLKRQSEELGKRNRNHAYRNMVFQSCRYKHCCSNMDIVPRKRKPMTSEPDFVPVQHPEVMLTVQIYRPEMEQVFHQRSIPSRTPAFIVEQQFLVLGSQCLTELRDQIICQSDAALTGEFSENPNATTSMTCQDLYKSGFFYINGTFYNDMRDEMNKDYSKVIIDWSKTAQDVGPFKTAKMEDTKFVDLVIQLGLPYVYQHQGHCEHMLVFSELRMATSHDPQNMMDYPLTHILQSKKPIRCMACMMYTARWITTEDKRLPEMPYFFCDKCFTTFNYDIEGKKIADFKAYKYFDKTAIY